MEQLFIGVMSSLYSVWDIVSRPSPVLVQSSSSLTGQCDDLIIRKVNTSDASAFAKRYGGSSRCWGVIWSVISVLFMAVAIVAAIAAFPESTGQQESDSKGFIPT